MTRCHYLVAHEIHFRCLMQPDNAVHCGQAEAYDVAKYVSGKLSALTRGIESHIRMGAIMAIVDAGNNIEASHV